MNTSEPGRLSRFLVSLGALGAVVIAAPLLLVAASRARFASLNPLSGIEAPWRWDLSEIADAVRNPLTDEVVVNLIVRTSLVVAWVAVAAILVTTVLEAIHLIRHRGIPLPSVRGLGGTQRIAHFIAAGLLVMIPLMSPRASLASSGGLASVAPAAASLDDSAGLTASPLSTTNAVGNTAAEGSPAQFHASSRDTAQLGSYPGSPTDAQPSSALANARAPRLHVVQHGESVYGIAEAVAAESSMTTTQVADAILDANLGTEMVGGQRFTNPAYIEIGWELLIPAHVLPLTTAVPSTPRVADWPSDLNAEADASDEEASDPSHIVHIIEQGETLSSIADQHLGNADEWPTIWAENRGDEMGGGQVFDDPNLILPGWEVDVPVAAGSESSETNDAAATDVSPDLTATIDTGDQPTSSQATAPQANSDDNESEAPAETPSTVDDTGDDTGDDIGDDQTESQTDDSGKPSQSPTPPPATVTTTPGSAAPPNTSASTSNTTTPTTTTVGSASESGAAGSQTSDTSPEAPSPLRIEHGALLAAGILALVGVRRRQRLRSAMPRARVPEPPPEVVATERRLRTIDSGERSTRVDVSIRAAAHCLVDSDAQVGLVMVDTDGAVEIRLTASAQLQAPWVAIDGSNDAGWALPASVPVEMLSEHARQVGTPCVALIQLGVCNGRDVLIDLEACGTLAIDAVPNQADDVVRAVAAGLASSPYAEVAHLVAVSLPTDALLGHRNAHQAASVGAAIELAVVLAGSTMTQERTSFSLRSLRTGGEMWEPAVVLLGNADSDQIEHVDASFPQHGHGLAVVAAVERGAWMSASARLLATDGQWTLEAFGCETEVTPVGLSAEELTQVVAVLDDADAPLIVDDEGRPRLTTTESIAIAAASASDHADPVPAPDPFEPMCHEIVVRLMGGVEISNHAGELGKFERSKTVELIAWLATHREKSTRTAARTALWELDVRDATFANVVSEARRSLGRLVAPVAEEEWLARTLTEQLPLHTSVVTDAQLIEERLTEARLQPPAHAVVTLRPAAEQIRDMPFAGTSYLWPDAEGITSNLVLLATSVTTELAAHALSLGDTDLVFWATGRGLTVLPGHEELIGLRMRAHARSGDLAGVRQEWESYERVIVADAWSDGEPAPKLLALRRELLTSPA